MSLGLTKRLVKGSALTAEEYDGNLDAFEEALSGFVIPEQFGAVGDGSTDDLTALDDALAHCVANGTILRLLAGATYGVSAPFVNASNNGIVLDGGGLYSQDAGVATIKKLSGFSGDAAIIWGRNNSSANTTEVNSGGIRGLRIDGNGQAGDGLNVRKAGSCAFEYVTAENNLGDGLVFDGVWESVIRSCKGRQNDDVGIRFTNTERKNTNVELFDLHATGNEDHQLLIASDATDSGLRPEQINFHGGLFENAGTEGLTGDLTAQPNPLVQIEACLSVNFYAANFMQQATGGTPTEAACLMLGKSGHTLLPEHVSIFGGRFQHGYTSTAYAVDFEADCGLVSIYSPQLQIDSSSKFLDASGLTSGLVHIHGDLPRADVNDTKDRVAIVAPWFDASRETSGGSNTRLSATNTDTLQLGTRDGAGGFTVGLAVGAGASQKHVSILDMDFVITPKAETDGDEPTGTVFYWNGTGSAPDGGANGEGLYIKKSGGWEFIK